MTAPPSPAAPPERCPKCGGNGPVTAWTYIYELETISACPNCHLRERSLRDAKMRQELASLTEEDYRAMIKDTLEWLKNRPDDDHDCAGTGQRKEKTDG